MDMRDQYGNRVGQMDAYGNPIQGRTDDYGNPLPATHGLGHGHGTTGGHGPTGYGATGAGVGGQPQMTHPATKEHHGGGILHRSNSSSSSSSEDDGMGGRRKKKGLKEKIKEKMPGGQKTTGDYVQAHAGTGYAGTTGTTTTTTGHRVEPEKKGMMEKIKEKLPGGQKTTDEYGHAHATTGTGTGYAGTTGPTTTTGHRVEPEKKGMMEKIKEKLPGQH